MERSTALNKYLKLPSCKPLGERIRGVRALNLFFPVLVLLLVAGCGGLPTARIPWEADRPAECQALFERLDAVVIEKGLRNAADAPVTGFPYLKANRFVASLAGGLSEPAAITDWAQWMRELDLAARNKEIANLPDDSVRTLATSCDTLAERVSACSQTLYDADRVRPDFFEVLVPRVAVPDEYSNALRLAGLYPLVTIPEYKITERVRERFRAWYEMPYEKLPVEGMLRVYTPPRGTSRDAGEVIAAASRNPLGIPRPSAVEARALAVRYAPIIIQDEAAPYDRVGRIAWYGDELTIDGTKPAVYYYLSLARVKGEPVFQVNYAFWYPARGGDRAPAIEHGRLDGLTLRLSFDPGGRLFMIDLMNNCGCYHVFIPAKDRVVRTIRRYYENDPFAPQGLPEIEAGQSPAVRIMSGWHQVQRILALAPPREGIPYALIPYDTLESLDHPAGHRASIFNADGIAKGSERVERFIFFPTGIPSIGSMRQRGHHAITLSEKTCFDEPELFEHYFVFR
ncbi:MAG: hypothetical protein HGB21_16350 [Nitrospirae bacterium]|jgi:hypothetical protein|nr:hypothetical protein [Nitrospirota bacterium]